MAMGCAMSLRRRLHGYFGFELLRARSTEDNGTCLYEEDLVNNCPADLTGDGNVGTGDLLLMLGMLGETCPD